MDGRVGDTAPPRYELAPSAEVGVGLDL